MPSQGADQAVPRAPVGVSGTPVPDPGNLAGAAPGPDGPPGRPEERGAAGAKPSWTMDASLAALLALTAALLVGAYLRGGWSLPAAGLAAGLRLLADVAPRLLFGFAMAGLFSVLVPTEAVARWMGQETGLRGVLVGALAGALTPGGPFVLFPLVAALVHRGAGVGPVAAYVTTWGLIPLQRLLVWEVPLLGPHVALARALASAALPILAGLLTPPLLRLLQALVPRL